MVRRFEKHRDATNDSSFVALRAETFKDLMLKSLSSLGPWSKVEDFRCPFLLKLVRMTAGVQCNCCFFLRQRSHLQAKKLGEESVGESQLI